MQNLKIHLVQTHQFWQDKSKNLLHFEQILNNANWTETPDLVLLPEMFPTGFTMDAKPNAELMNGVVVQWMQEQAKKFGTIIAGSVIINENNAFYNRFLMVSEKGVLSHYDKRHLFRMANENEHYSPGKERVIFELKGWRILLQVCYDLRFPVFSRNRTINGEKEYDAVLYVANWPAKRRKIWRGLLVARAMENQAFVVGVNRIGEDGNGIPYAGDSLVCDPWGNIMFDAADNEVDKTVLLERDTLKEIEEKFPAFLDADDFELQFNQ